MWNIVKNEGGNMKSNEATESVYIPTFMISITELDKQRILKSLQKLANYYDFMDVDNPKKPNYGDWVEVKELINKIKKQTTDLVECSFV